MNTTTNANAMTAQELHAAVVSKAVSVPDAIKLLTDRIARCEAEGRKPRAPSVQLLAELTALKPRGSVGSLKNPVEALKDAKAQQREQQPAKPEQGKGKPNGGKAQPKPEPAKAADKSLALTDAQLLDLVRERASADAAFRSQVGKLFIELANA